MRWHRRLALGAAITTTVCAGSAWAAGQQQAGAVEATQGASSRPEPARNAPDPDKRICKRTTATGSRFAKQVCRTQAQWDESEQATRRQMRDIDAIPAPLNGQGVPASTGP